MAQMICGVLSDEVDDGDARPAGVVQIRKAVRETGAEMQKRACGFFSHARIAVSRSRDDTFEQTEHAPYCRHSLKRSDKMNFRSAGVGEAHFNPTRHQGANETFCTIHLFRQLYPFRFAGVDHRKKSSSPDIQESAARRIPGTWHKCKPTA
jgi:hypothetical protein